MTASPAVRPKIFISYSHKDKNWKDRLLRHLRVAAQEDDFELWDDQCLQAGGDWRDGIFQAIESCGLALLLVSTDFLSSKFIRQEEVPLLLQRRRQEGLPVVPVLLHSCLWQHIEWLSCLQALPRDGAPLEQLREDQLEAELARIAEEVWQLMKTLGGTSPDPLVREGYLDWLCRTHQTLRGISIQGRRAPEVDLKEAYVALRADAAGLAERLESRRQLKKVEARGSVTGEDSAGEVDHRIAERHAYTLAHQERSLVRSFLESGEETLPLADACRRHRALVILGDPGSGKTTLARWLALNNALALARGLPHVCVPAHQVDLRAGEGESEIVLGPARLPILLRIAELADAVRQGRYQGSLAGFLGQDSAFGRPTYPRGHKRYGQAMDAADLRRMIVWHLERNQVLLLLDGLDEITAEAGRGWVAQAVEQFIDDFVSALPVQGEPWQAGGNQVVITSRIAGYHAEPLQRQLPHFVIEPLGEPGIRYFCGVWTAALHKVLGSGDVDDPSRSGAAEQDAAALAREILDPERPGLRELATNPLLISVLVTVYLTNYRRLPERRVELYEITVDDNLARVWRSRNPRMDVEAMLELLGSLAAHIHDSTSTGLLTRRALRAWLEEAIVALPQRGGGPLLAVEEAWNALCQDVGLLVEKGAGFYGFLHLTFEEYLAGRSLVRDPPRAAEAMALRLRDPRWREPLLLALGHAGLHWPPQRYSELFDRLLEADDPEDRVPAAALLLAEALQEIPDIPPDRVRHLAGCLLDAAASEGFAALERQAEEAMGFLVRGGGGRFASQVEDALCAALEATGPGEEELVRTAGAAARFLRAHQFFSERLGQALVTAARHGAGGPEIYRALEDLTSWNRMRQIVGRKPLREISPETMERLSESLLAPLAGLRMVRWTEQERADPQPVSLSAAGLPMRRVLLTDPELARFIARDPDWLRLITALFGGLGNFRVPELRAEMARRVRELEAGGPDPKVQRRLAVRLDTDLRPRLSILSQEAPRFSAEHVFFPSPLAGTVLEALHRREPAQDLAERLRAIWRGSPASPPVGGAAANVLAGLWERYLGPVAQPDPSAPVSGGAEEASVALRAEALIGLAALGVEVESELEATTDPRQRPVLAALRRRLDDLATSLEDPVARIGQDSLLELLLPTSTVDGNLWMAAAIRAIEVMAVSGGTVNPISLLEKMTLSDEAQAQLRSEIWSALFSGSTPDWRYNFAVSLDGIGRTLSQFLVESMVRVRHAGNRLWPQHLGWVDEDLEPLPSTPRDAVLAALEVIAQMPPGAPFVQSWALSRLAPALRTAHPELLPEVLAVTLTLLQGDAVCLSDALEDLAPDLQAVPPSRRVTHLLAQARALESPYLRFRVLLLLLREAPERLPELFPEMLTAARQKIASVLEEIYIWERLLLLSPPGAELPLIERILSAANREEDLEVKALLLGRSAVRYLSGEERRRWLLRALRAAAEIASPGRRSETLRRLGSALEGDAEAGREWRRQVAGLPALQRARALGLAAPALAVFEPFVRLDSEERVAAWGALSLLARLRDLRRFVDLAEDELGGLWGRMAEGDEEAFRKLTERGATAAIAWDPATPGIFQNLLDQGREGQVAEILSLLEPPARSLLPVLRRWRSIPRLTQIVDLLTTEADELTSETLPSFVELLQDNDDRLRLRAALALYQLPAGQLRRATHLGQATVEALMRYRLELGPELPRISLAFAWAMEQVLLDSSEMLRSWARIADEGSSSASDCDPSIARRLLGEICFVDEAVWEVFLEQLEQRGPVPQRELLLSITRMAFKQWSRIGQGLSEEQSHSLRSALRRLAADSPDEIVRVRAIEALGWVGRDIAALRSWVAGDTTVASAALVALGRLGSELQNILPHLADPRPGVAVAAAEGLLRAGVAAQELLERTGDERLVQEGLLHACTYLFIGPDFHRAVQNSATFLVESADRRLVAGGEDLLAAMVRRLDAVLADEQAWRKDAEEVDNLLPVVAAAAERMPATFSALGGQLGRRFVQRLQSAAVIVNYFPCREAAIVLLSLLRDLDATVLPVLRATLYDVPDVRRAALRSVERLRDVRLDALEELIPGLVKEPSPLARYAVSRVLTTMARNPRLEPAVRRPVRDKVRKALAQALRDPRSQHYVHLLEGESSSSFRMRALGRLDQLFYQALLELSVPDAEGLGSRSVRETAGEGSVWLEAPARGREPSRMEIILGKRGVKNLLDRQLSWYLANGGGTFPPDILQSLEQLQEIAEGEGVALSDLVRHAVERSQWPIYTKIEDKQ